MNYRAYLTEAGVPAELHDQAIKSFRAAALPALIRALIGIPAFFFWLLLGWAVPRSAERLPWLLRWADNNISINGDRTDWARRDDGTYYRQLAPDEDRVDENGRHLSYAPGHSPRSYRGRFAFNGKRNRAGYLALLWGRNVAGQLQIDAAGNPVPERWGQLDQDRAVMGCQVARCGDVWELRRTSQFGRFVRVWSAGFELGNCNAIDLVATPTWCPGVPMGSKAVPAKGVPFKTGVVPVQRQAPGVQPFRSVTSAPVPARTSDNLLDPLNPLSPLSPISPLHSAYSAPAPCPAPAESSSWAGSDYGSSSSSNSCDSGSYSSDSGSSSSSDW